MLELQKLNREFAAKNLLSMQQLNTYTTFAGFLGSVVGTLTALDIIPEKWGIAATAICFAGQSYLTNRPSKEQVLLNNTVITNRAEIYDNKEEIKQIKTKIDPNNLQ